MQSCAKILLPPASPSSTVAAVPAWACRLELFGLGFVFTTRWSSPAFHGLHPSRWATPAFTSSDGYPFEYENGLFNAYQFGAEFGQHFCDIHRSMIARRKVRSSRLGSALKGG